MTNPEPVMLGGVRVESAKRREMYHHATRLMGFADTGEAVRAYLERVLAEAQAKYPDEAVWREEAER